MIPEENIFTRMRAKIQNELAELEAVDDPDPQPKQDSLFKSNLNDIAQKLLIENPDKEEEDQLVGHASGGPAWAPNDQVKDSAKDYGYGQGRDPLIPMQTPKGRIVGFPFTTTRTNQLEAVDAVIDGFKAGCYVLLEGPTGFGKSPVNIAIASHYQSSYMLIGRNDLVDQWEKDFEHLEPIGFYKSRGRFDCNQIKAEGKSLTCSQAKVACSSKRKTLKKEKDDAIDSGQPYDKEPCPDCPYAVNRDISLSKPHSVMTLSLGLTIFKYMASHPAVTRRDVLIIDECSELETEIMKFFEFQVSTKTVFRAVSKSLSMDSFYNKEDPFYVRWPQVTPDTKFGEAIVKMKPLADIHSVVRWAVEVSGLVKMRLGWLKQDNEEVAKIKEHCEHVLRMASNILSALSDNVPCFGEVVDEEDGTYRVRISPLEARGMLERLLSPFAKHLLFVSATTGTAEMFTKTHGLQNRVHKVSVPSSFRPENRMVYNLRAGNMSAKTQAAESPFVMDLLVKLAKQTHTDPRFNHTRQRGIIHTYNNKVTDMVFNAFKAAGLVNRVLVLRGSGKAREQVMQAFNTSSQPLILISPSAMLGLSLNDDMARWQAIVKIPYAFLGDPSVVHRKDNISGWYEWQTAKDLLQTFGRIVRSDTDWGSTYILDDAFTNFYARNKQLFPNFIQEAIWQKS